MKMNKKLLTVAIGATLATTAQTTFAVTTALPAKAALNATSGVYFCPIAGTYPSCYYSVVNVAAGTSYFSMDQNGDGIVQLGEKVPITVNSPYDFSDTTTATGSHSGPIDGSESPVSDIWEFFGGTGMHYLSSAMVDNGDGTIDMTGWNVTWNGIATIPMGGDTANFGTDTGLATITCGVDCSAGDTFVLTYSAHVPLGDVSGFGGVGYGLNLEGTIVDLNQAPTAVSGTVSSSVAPSSSTLINVIGNVTDPDGNGEIDAASVQVTYAGTATIELCTGAAAPNGLCDVAGNLVYTDTGGTPTTDSFTYTISDIYGASTSAVTVNMDVVVGNLPPSCGGAVLATNLGTPIDVTVPNYATDGDGTVDVTTVVVTGTPVNGTPGTPTVAGVVTFTPSAAGTASFDYTVNDDAGATCPSAGTITINVNDLPVAVDDTGVTVERNSSVLINVPVNDTDSDGTLDKTTVTIVSAAAHGTTSVDALTGKVTYTPTPANIYTGADSFTYTIDDNSGATSNAATVSITIANATPVAANDSGLSIDLASVSSLDIDVLANDTDPDGTLVPATVTIIADVTNGTTSVNTGTGVVTYTPSGTGSDQFTYTVKDNDTGTSNVATVNISVSDSSGGDFGLLKNSFLLITPANVVDKAIKPTSGSYFSMETNPGVSYTYTAIEGRNGLQEGTTQAAFSGKSVVGEPTIPASPNIDNIWSFFGNSGVHQTTSPANELTDDGAGNVTLDLSGWAVSWNGIASIPMNSSATVAGFVDGVAKLTCSATCAYGETYVLEYSATVPLGDASGFGGVHYFLHLEGIVSKTAVQLGGGNVAAVYDVTVAAAADDAGSAVTIMPGATADSVGNTTGTGLTTVDVGLKDPKLNEADGAQCIGGCIDFYATGVTPGSYVDLVVYLSEAIPEGAVYRKLMNGVWQDFDTSLGDQVGSAMADTGACQGPDGVFSKDLIAGNQCLFLRIYDGGPNDADGLANGTIVDPSGVLQSGSPNVPASSTDGCSVSNVPVKLNERADWLLVAAFIAGFGLLTYRRRERNIR